MVLSETRNRSGEWGGPEDGEMLERRRLRYRTAPRTSIPEIKAQAAEAGNAILAESRTSGG